MNDRVNSSHLRPQDLVVGNVLGQIHTPDLVLPTQPTLQHRADDPFGTGDQDHAHPAELSRSLPFAALLLSCTPVLVDNYLGELLDGGLVRWLVECDHSVLDHAHTVARLQHVDVVMENHDDRHPALRLQPCHE